MPMDISFPFSLHLEVVLGVLQLYFVERHQEFDRNQVKIHEVLKDNLVEIEEMERMFGPDHFMPPLPMNEPAPMQLERRRQSALPPRPQMPFQRSQALSSKTMVPGMKRKADAIVATTVPKKIQKPALDWRCHVNEAGLNEHLGGSTHQGKLPDHGARKAIGIDKTYSLMTTGNNNGPIHEVVQKDNLLCDQCDFRCSNDETMVVHLRSEKHCIKVLTLMKAARENTKSKEYFGLSL